MLIWTYPDGRRFESGTRNHAAAFDALENPDNIELSENSDGSPDTSRAGRNSDGTQVKKIIYEKPVDGKLYVVEVVPDNKRKKIRAISAYMNNKGQMVNAQDGPASTSENASARITKPGIRGANTTKRSPGHTSETAPILPNLAEDASAHAPTDNPSVTALADTPEAMLASSSDQIIPQVVDGVNGSSADGLVFVPYSLH